MKKSFMTRVLAVSLSAAMAFSMSSASNLMTASAASTVNLKTTFKTLKVNQTYKMTLKNNTLNWKITKVTTSNKKICTVYGKTASSVMLKGKGVGRAKISVKVKTTKRKYPKNIKTMKCTAKVVAADPGQTTEAFSATAAANSNTEVRVNFTQAVDSAAPENFTFADRIEVTNAELSADKKSVLLTIAGAEYSNTYEMTVTGIKVGGAVQADQKLSFTTPAATVTNPVELKADDAILKSDGQAQTNITFKISDAEGKPLETKGIEVEFQASLGKFATDRVAIQNGEAKVMYTSAVLSENRTVQITATIVESPDDTALIGTSAVTTVTLMPNPDLADDSSIGATITSITAPTADRIYAYFNKEVKAEDFKKGDKLDSKKFSYEIKSGVDNGYADAQGVTQTHDIVGIYPVENDPCALQFLVDKPMTDNTIIKVDFENKTTSGGIYIPKNTVYCKLTDARQPAVVNVTAKNQRELEIEFSEAVIPSKYFSESGPDARNAKFAADNLDNYLIDGISLKDPYWGTIEVKQPSEDKAVSISDKNTTLKILSEKKNDPDDQDKNGEIKVGANDKRNVVTIKLSRDRYLEAGRTHRISIANVGDWAAWTDGERNIVSTEGFDFPVDPDETTPSFTATAMSPEQYLLEFNSDIVTVVNGDTIKTPASNRRASVIKLEVKNANGVWTEISNGFTESGKNPIMVSRITEDDTLTNKYLVEVMRDWTQVYNTSTSKDNYYRHEYRLSIEAGKIVNPVNNNKNPELHVELTDNLMRTPDSTSPEIERVDPSDDDTDSWNVFMTEPVKLSSTANEETLTPSETQRDTNGMGVPAPEAQFVNVSDRRTIEGIIETNQFVDAYDQVINVTPETELSNGDWQLIISSISDDVGRTSTTLVREITIDNPVSSTNFRVLWAAVGNNLDWSANTENGQGRYIYVKFNKPVTMFGNSTNAQSVSNYTLNGSPLPTGTEIRAHIKGYDENVGLGSGITDSITIILPSGTYSWSTGSDYPVSSSNAMLNISKTITCATTGEVLDNGGMIRIPYQYGSAPSSGVDTDAATRNVPTIGSLNSSTDAVWGNDISETYVGSQGDSRGIRDRQKYYEALKAALENEQYRRVILTANQNLDLTNTADDAITNVFGRSGVLRISRPVDVDLNGSNIRGNIVVSTENTAKSMYIYSSNGTATITGKSASRDATLTVNAGGIGEFYIQNVRVERSDNSNGTTAVSLNDVWRDSFVLEGNSSIEGDIQVNDTNGFGLCNKSAYGAAAFVNGSIYLSGSGVVNLKGDFSGKSIYVSQGSEIHLGDPLNEVNTNISGTIITISSSDAKIYAVDAAGITTSSATEIIALVKGVEVYPGKNDQLPSSIFKRGVDGGFVQIKDDGSKAESNGLSDGDTDLSPVAYALEDLDILPGVDVDGSRKGNVTITTGAIKVATGGGLDLTALTTQVQQAPLMKAPGQELGDGAQHAIVEYYVESTNLVQLSRNTVTVKDNIENVTKTDVIRVVLKYNNESYVRTITIKKG